MKTIGCGLVQIPIVTRYKVFCIRRSLAGGVTSTGWQQILGCTLRILLLSSWGLKSIDYTLPQTAEKIIGVYIEFGLLSLQVANGIVILIGLWANNVFFLYPTLVIIPGCFLTDIIIKGSCYAALFLTPEVTSFGVLSLIEVWFRGLSLMYGWIIIISYIYYKRNDWKLTEVNIQLNPKTPDRVSAIVRRASSKSPFSRNSSLSQRGRRSFLLRNPSKKANKSENGGAGQGVKTSPEKLSENENITQYDTALLKQTVMDNQNPNSNHDENSSMNNDNLTDSVRDGESDILLGESAMMSMKRIPSQRNKRDISNPGSYSDKTGSMASKPFIPTSLQRSPPPRYKKRGGFIPEVLRTPSSIDSSKKPEALSLKRKTSQKSQRSAESESTLAANTIELSTSAREPSDDDEASLLRQSKSKKHKSHMQTQSTRDNDTRPPSLPSRPPVGRLPTNPPRTKPSGLPHMNWFKRIKDNSPPADSPVALGKKHVPDPVLV